MTYFVTNMAFFVQEFTIRFGISLLTTASALFLHAVLCRVCSFSMPISSSVCLYFSSGDLSKGHRFLKWSLAFFLSWTKSITSFPKRLFNSRSPILDSICGIITTISTHSCCSHIPSSRVEVVRPGGERSPLHPIDWFFFLMHIILFSMGKY